MVDIHVQPHSDRIGGDQEVDLAGGAAPAPAQQLGDGVDRLGREGDDGTPPRQAREFGRTGMGQL